MTTKPTTHQKTKPKKQPNHPHTNLATNLPATLLLLLLTNLQPTHAQPPTHGQGRDRLITQPGPQNRAGVPEWQTTPNFPQDIFTFVRIQYHNTGDNPFRRGGGSWQVDHPAADLNFSYRLQQLTTIKVNPQPKILTLTDQPLPDYPFIFIIDPRRIHLTQTEAQKLRHYLLNGGFLMIDDFWGETMMQHFLNQMTKVFPNRKPQKLPNTHPIFHCVFQLQNPPQVPSEDSAHRNRGTPHESWEDEIHNEPPAPANYQAFLDDQNRIMILICHNTDLSDGWEEEGISQWFFTNYSEKYSYPMGINIIYYALTH